MCILVVEDEDIVREILVEELNFQGFDVCQSHSGDHATDLIKNPPRVFSLLITDINMPGQRNGIEVAQLMHLHSPSVPIIFITGRPDISNFARPLASNEVLLRKPFAMSELTQVVTRMLDGSHHHPGRQSG